MHFEHWLCQDVQDLRKIVCISPMRNICVRFVQDCILFSNVQYMHKFVLISPMCNICTRLYFFLQCTIMGMICARLYLFLQCTTMGMICARLYLFLQCSASIYMHMHLNEMLLTCFSKSLVSFFLFRLLRSQVKG